MVMDDATTPRFFKVLVGDFARRIEIPKAFLCHIPRESRRASENTGASHATVLLKNGNGKIWPVELHETEGRVFLTTGWSKFVDDNCLVQGQFLVFECNGDIQFTVIVFDVNAVEKSVCSSGCGAGNFKGRPTVPSHTTKEVDKNLTHSHSQSTGELETYMSWKWSMEDDKAQAIAKVMKRLDVDRLTVDLFCAALSLYKWDAEAAAEEFDICRGKQHIPPEQTLKRKLFSQFNFIKEQLRQFFPLCNSSCAPMHERRKNNIEIPDPSNQPLPCDSLPVKRKIVDKHKSCDSPHQQKRKVGKLQRGSPHTQTRRRSPRLKHLRNTFDRTDNILEERSEVLDPSPDPKNQVKDRADKKYLLHEKQDSILKGGNEELIGPLPQDFRRGSGKEGTERNAIVISSSFESTSHIESESLLIDSELTSGSRIAEVYFTWKPSQQRTRLESILLDIERENFMTTITHIQKIIQDECPDLQTAKIIEDIVQTGIRKWDLCLQDSNAQKILTALLKHAKIVKEQQNFNIEARKEVFSAKIQDRSKWQLKELETGYTFLELEYKKATQDASICFLTLESHKKNLHAVEDDIKEQTLIVEEDELHKLRRLVSEHQTLYQKSIMEKVKLKMGLKSYQQTLDKVKRRLASTESDSVDVQALVKEEADNMRKEIELSKGSILSIKFTRE